MKSTILSVTGWEEAITTMFLSKKTWTPDLGQEIRKAVEISTDRYGQYAFVNRPPVPGSVEDEYDKKFRDWTTKLLSWGKKHITMIRFIDITIMTQGMHRAGQDDIDAHARRFDNRIIRNSTRITITDGSRSEFYQDKIKSDYEIAKILGIELPGTVDVDGETWIRATNGYVKQEYVDNKDVRRGLYMLSIPSDFISKINLCEWGHVFKERCNEGGANPEVKKWAEETTRQLSGFNPLLTRQYVRSIEN